jgi:hypothetical protein
LPQFCTVTSTAIKLKINLKLYYWGSVSNTLSTPYRRRAATVENSFSQSILENMPP